MDFIAGMFIIQLMLSVFVYVGLIILVEMFKPRAATVPFKWRLFAFSVAATYALMFVSAG